MHLPSSLLLSWVHTSVQRHYQRRSYRSMQLGIVSLFSFSRRHFADSLKKAAMVEPVDSFEGGEFDSFKRAPRPAPADHLRS
jgi:hypothetical protein